MFVSKRVKRKAMCRWCVSGLYRGVLERTMSRFPGFSVRWWLAGGWTGSHGDHGNKFGDALIPFRSPGSATSAVSIFPVLLLFYFCFLSALRFRWPFPSRRPHLVDFLVSRGTRFFSFASPNVTAQWQRYLVTMTIEFLGKAYVEQLPHSKFLQLPGYLAAHEESRMGWYKFHYLFISRVCQ